LFEGNIFQFDFLNDDLNGDKVPKALKDILNDPEKRKKLVIYINPPYAEATNLHAISGTGLHKAETASTHNMAKKYLPLIGAASNEVFAQFLVRIQHEIKAGVIAQFSKTKILQAGNYKKFRQQWTYALKKLFLVPSSTFDNVAGDFPIGFFIWEKGKPKWENIEATIYNNNGESVGSHKLICYEGQKNITEWHKDFFDENANDYIGWLHREAPDIFHNRTIYITEELNDILLKRKSMNKKITAKNLIPFSVYFTIRSVIPATWLNDRDQYLFPKDTWQEDTNFINNCLTYALFYNRIDATKAPNHWIPFTEDEVGARQPFQSTFMTDFIKGKIKHPENDGTLLQIHKSFIPMEPLHFSQEAQEVFNAGREIWRYYYKNVYGDPAYNVNASLYNIKEFFKGRNEKGKMNNKSKDEHFNALEKTLSDKMKTLAKAIEPKVYEHGFLLK
ncbi:MAG: hypothetical protein J6P19_05635, partial [Acetobacter sp.]|nr:hypothetical protein [Acetobacter sp.]